ncbi:MAG: ComF family protein [Pseudomonadota bacterium]
MSNPLIAAMNGCLYFAQNHLPHPCLLCGTTVRGRQLCPGCADDLPFLPAARCPRCALPSPEGQVCGTCLRRPPAFDHAVAVFAYAFPVDALVRHCKYQGALEVAEFFAAAMAGQLSGHTDVDLILPMPLHPARLGERGFNQAAQIARHLAARLDLPWQATACERLRDTPPQAGLDLKARRRNLRGAFRCGVDLVGRRVALVDDVMTSGASLNELAKEAKRAGAAEVSAWVVARTL